MKISHKEATLIRAMKNLPSKDEEQMPKQRENSIICAVFIAKEKGLLDDFISIAEKSDSFDEAFTEMIAMLPDAEEDDEG